MENVEKNKIKKETGKNVADKIFLHGYSSSGVFAQRFALIHPEIVGRVLIGGASGSIPLPTTDFEYPLGIKDFRQLFGTDFNEDEYRKIQFAYYVGEFEARKAGNFDINGDRITSDMQIPAPMHDMSFRSVSTPKEVGIEQRKLLGQTLNERYKNAIEANKRYGIDIEGVTSFIQELKVDVENIKIDIVLPAASEPQKQSKLPLHRLDKTGKKQSPCLSVFCCRTTCKSTLQPSPKSYK